MQTEYDVLRDALIEIAETASGGSSAFSDFIDIDDDDLVDMALGYVDALRDAYNECVDERTNDIE